MGDWLFTSTYLNSEQEEANYRILDAGTGISGDKPLPAVLTAPDGSQY